MRIHNSATSLSLDSRVYQAKRTYQPEGFWYGIDASWVNWCKANMPELVGKYNYVIHPYQAKRILHLDVNYQVIKFHYLYRNKEHPLAGIHWERVMEEYDGIEITNFRAFSPELLTEGYLWHMAWQVDCGCIWRNFDIRPMERKELIAVFR
jgi:hypothetical protein